MKKSFEGKSTAGPAQNADHPQKSNPGSSEPAVVSLEHWPHPGLIVETIKEQNE